jgi:hypothetical protein
MVSISLSASLSIGMICVALPAWSMPEPTVSHAASDLAPDRLVPNLVDTHQSSPQKTVDLQFSAVDAIAQLTPFESTAIESKIIQSEAVESEAVESEAIESEAIAQATAPPDPATPKTEIKSPVLEKWQRQTPNVLEDIKRDPSFRTRARLGLSYFPSTFDSLGWHTGVEDVFIGKTNLTFSADYQATFTGRRKAGGANLRYYLFPLGGYVNLAPVLGYRYLETPRYVTDGLDVGVRVQFVPSRTSGADISFTQTWVAPGQSDEVGVSTLSFGYALTQRLRLSTDIQKQNSKQKRDTRFAIGLEWMF